MGPGALFSQRGVALAPTRAMSDMSRVGCWRAAPGCFVLLYTPRVRVGAALVAPGARSYAIWLHESEKIRNLLC